GRPTLPPATCLPLELLSEITHQAIQRDTILLQGVTIPHRHRAVLRRLAVDRDAEGRPGLVLPAIAPPDRAAIVVEHVVVLAKIVEYAPGQLRHPVLVHERKDRRFERRQRRMEPQHDALFAFYFLFAVGI